MSSITNFTLALTDLDFYGHDLARPESVLASKDGTLWVSDMRGTVTRIDPDGGQTTLGQSGGEPNGLAMDREGNIYIANIVDGKIYKLTPDGQESVFLSEVDGQKLGLTNFVWIDSRGRFWISILTRAQPWFLAAADPRPDGYIVLVDDSGARVVADGIIAANEIRLDAQESYLYVAETMAARILRYPVNEDGSLGKREVFGPNPLGHGAYVDGITFDAAGNLWVATPLRNGLRIITPDGESHVVFEDANPEAVDALVAAIDAGTLNQEIMGACAGQTLQFPTSITFAGPDLQTVYMGSLAMPRLITFRSPVPGRPMHHW